LLGTLVLLYFINR